MMKSAYLMTVSLLLNVVAHSSICAAQQGTKQGGDYLKPVKDYADALIEHGRDVYGKTTSPLFASALDPKTMKMFQGERLKSTKKLPRAHWDIRITDRDPTTANPMYDQNLYQILYALSKVTGDPKYARAADEALRWFFNNCRSKGTDLLAWGEHAGWDLFEDRAVGNVHEYGRPWVLWERSFQLAPESCGKFALGVWKHQIVRDGDRVKTFSRHARLDRHGPGSSSEYPRHGGFYIHTWAAAYKLTGKPEFLTAIDGLLSYYESRRNPQTGALPCESHRRSRSKVVWVFSNLSLAIDLENAAKLVPNKLAVKLRQSAKRTDKVFLSLPHDLALNGKGFVGGCATDTLKVNYHGKGLWAGGYGSGSEASKANQCMLRYRQIKDERYKVMILKTGKRYIGKEVPRTYFNVKHKADFSLNPGALGGIIYLMLNCYELTKENIYLKEAQRFATAAKQLFFAQGNPLPFANVHQSLHHYETPTGSDTLMMALLRLALVIDGKEGEVRLICTDR